MFFQAELVQIGTHDAATDELTLNEEEVKKMWKGIGSSVADATILITTE